MAHVNPKLESTHPHGLLEDIGLFDTTIEDNDIDLAAQGQHRIVDEPDEEGELLGILLATNSSNLIPELKCWHEGVDPDTVNDLRIVDMVKYGMGLTPGDVELMPSGRSQDHIGVKDDVFFYVVRYKDDDLADYLGDETRTYVVKFTPKPEYKYTGISFYVKNTSTDTDAIIKQVILRRRVRGLHPEESEHLDEPEIVEDVEGDTEDPSEFARQTHYPAQPNFDYSYTQPEPIAVEPTTEYTDEDEY